LAFAVSEENYTSPTPFPAPCIFPATSGREAQYHSGRGSGLPPMAARMVNVAALDFMCLEICDQESVSNTKIRDFLEMAPAIGIPVLD
jgi:hypothetical protein